METIQVVLDAKLLQAADRVAKRQKVNRSALLRRALQEHWRTLPLGRKIEPWRCPPLPVRGAR